MLCKLLVQEPAFRFEVAREVCLKRIVKAASNFTCIQLVYGFAGNYIRLYIICTNLDFMQTSGYYYKVMMIVLVWQHNVN